MAESGIEIKPQPSYEDAYRKLYNSYRERLNNSLEAIDNILTQRQLKPLAKEDLLRAQHMAHSLAGSGTTFGFPEVTAAGQKADSFIEKIIRPLTTNKTIDDKQFAEVEKVLMALRSVCEAAYRRAEDNSPPSVPQGASRKLENSSHILVVDDDQHLGELLSMKLQQRSLKVTVAKNGDAAMDTIRKSIPDLVILDISMPGMSGHEVLRKLKQDPEFVKIPILMLTGQADQKDIVSALHSGAMDYILKPFDSEKLLSRIEKILDARRHTVLIADNDPLVLQLLTSKLKYAGFKVFLLDDGQKAWAKIQTSMPDLVILDWMMPGLDGLTVIKKMRDTALTRNIPAIIISARKEDSDIESGIKAGAQKYLVKPFLSDDLIDECRRILKERKTNIEIERREILFDNADMHSLLYDAFNSDPRFEKVIPPAFSSYQILGALHTLNFADVPQETRALMMGLIKPSPPQGVIFRLGKKSASSYDKEKEIGFVVPDDLMIELLLKACLKRQTAPPANVTKVCMTKDNRAGLEFIFQLTDLELD